MKKKQLKNKKTEKYFDNCPICQAMKNAEEKDQDLTLEELEEAFNEARKKGAVVGKIYNEYNEQKSS